MGHVRTDSGRLFICHARVVTAPWAANIVGISGGIGGAFRIPGLPLLVSDTRSEKHRARRGVETNVRSSENRVGPL